MVCSTKPFCAVWLSPQLPVDCQKSPGVPLPPHLSSQRSPYTVFPIFWGCFLRGIPLQYVFGQSEHNMFVQVVCLCVGRPHGTSHALCDGLWRHVGLGL